jgi:hypothetical protein
MRASRQMWISFSTDKKLEYLYEQTEELHKSVDQLTAVVDRFRQQLAVVQRGHPGTSS